MHQQQVLHNQTIMQRVEREKSSRTGQRAAQEVLLLCTTASITPEDKSRLSEILAQAVDWRYLLDLAEFHGVIPLIAHNLVTNDLSSKVPQPYLDRLNRIYHSTLYRNVILSTELASILSIFRQHRIAAIPLKGTILAEILYGNPALRTVTDMDILVHPEDASLAGSLLVKLGYKQLSPSRTWDHPFHEIPYCKQAIFPLFVELHWDLEDRAMVSFPLPEIWRRAQPLQSPGVSTMVLSSEDNLLFLANHLSKQDTQLLRFLGDIAELLRKYNGHLDWDYIIESAHSWQVEATVYYSLKRARDILGAPVPAYSLDTLKPSTWRRWVLDFLLSPEAFVSINRNRLVSETSVLARSLMMKHTHQILTVLSRYRGSGKKGAWLRTAIWIMLVFIVGLGRNGIKIASRRQGRVL